MLPGDRVVNAPPLTRESEAVGVGAGVGVDTVDGCGVTVNCVPGVPGLRGRTVFLKDVGVVPTFVVADPPQPLRMAMSIRKMRRQPLLYLFIIIYLLPKVPAKDKKLAIDRTF